MQQALLYLCSASIATRVNGVMPAEVHTGVYSSAGVMPRVMPAEVYTPVCAYTLRVRMRLVVATRFFFLSFLE